MSEHIYTVHVSDDSPFFDPSNGVVFVAFTERYDDNDQPVPPDRAMAELVNELQHASNEGILSGDFQVAEIERQEHHP